jgi:protein-disulfide isomerase
MIVFSDFECRYCGSFAKDTWGRLREEYVDRAKLLVAFRHLPLPIHAAAFPAAQAAECARRQGKFWEMHDLIFGDQARLNTPTFRTHARQLELDERQWESCYTEDAPRKVKDDVSSARALGIEATPVFLIGTIQKDGRVRAVKRLDGAKSFEVFAAALGEIAGR